MTNPTYIADNFNRAGSLLQGSTSAGDDTGAGGGWDWTKVGTSLINDLVISGNQVAVGSGASNRLYYANTLIGTEQMGAEVEVKADNPNSRGAILALHVQDGNNYIWGGYNNQTGAVQIESIIGGVGEALGVKTLSVGARPVAPYTVAFTFGAGLVDPTLAGNLTLWINGVEVLTTSVTNPDVLLFPNHVGIAYFPFYFSNNEIQNDNFFGGSPWFLPSLSGTLLPPSTADDSNPLVQRVILDEQRRANLLGGRQNTELTSPQGLTDAVPVARVHLVGRCG